MYDLVIKGGQVIDPSQNLNSIRDVAVTAGKITAISESIEAAGVHQVIDASGLIVVPGLIDLHVHVYPHISIGLDADSLCPAGGVTTMLDAGSAGSHNFGPFRRDTIDRSETQVLGLVNLCCIGLAASSFGELLDRRYADPTGVVRTIERHRDVAVGVKIRAGKHIIGAGEQGWANLRDAVAAARDSGTWLMVHIGECPMSIPELVAELQPGDCITHCFKGGSTRVTDDEGRVFESLVDASSNGIVFDVGHGYGSFQWEVAAAAVEQGFEPTTISTDLHIKNLHGPVYDMPTTMSKFLLLGVPLERVIDMSTTRPAKLLNRTDQLGTLRPGTIADIAILERRVGKFRFTDSYKQHRVGNELLIASSTIRRGEIVPGGGGLRMRHQVD